LFLVIPTDFAFRAWTVATAFASLGFLALAMSIGPIWTLRGSRPPKHVEWRRDLGIWAGVVGLVHVLVGLRVHFAGVWQQYFVYGPDETAPAGMLRFDPIGVANWLGLLATLIFAMLLATSNNASIRRFGLDGWKRVQRGAYILVVAAAIHGAIYQALTKRPFPAVALLWLIVGSLGALQLAGVLRTRARARAGDG
jgi:sulfoxide reductase heme-binding subunit YedZ